MFKAASRFLASGFLAVSGRADPAGRGRRHRFPHRRRWSLMPPSRRQQADWNGGGNWNGNDGDQPRPGWDRGGDRGYGVAAAPHWQSAAVAAGPERCAIAAIYDVEILRERRDVTIVRAAARGRDFILVVDRPLGRRAAPASGRWLGPGRQWLAWRLGPGLAPLVAALLPPVAFCPPATGGEGRRHPRRCRRFPLADRDSFCLREAAGPFARSADQPRLWKICGRRCYLAHGCWRARTAVRAAFPVGLCVRLIRSVDEFHFSP